MTFTKERTRIAVVVLPAAARSSKPMLTVFGTGRPQSLDVVALVAVETELRDELDAAVVLRPVLDGASAPTPLRALDSCDDSVDDDVLALPTEPAAERPGPTELGGSDSFAYQQRHY